MTYFEYAFLPFKETFDYAISLSRRHESRVFMRRCTCDNDFAGESHFAISVGSSNNYLQWLNRNGQ